MSEQFDCINFLENIEVIFYVNSFGENSFVKYQYLTTFLINFMFK